MNFKLRLETKKQKIIALILAIVSVILCVAIVLVTVASCSGGSEGGKTVRRVVKKKVIIVQEPDTSSDTDNGNNDNNTYYDVVDDDYDGPEEVVDIVEIPDASTDKSSDTDNSLNSDIDSSDDTGESSGLEYEVELKGESKTPMTDKIAFGFWTYEWGEWTQQFGDKYGKETDIITTASIGNIDEARYVKENGVSGWWIPNHSTAAFVSKDSTELSEKWKENIISTAEAYKLVDVWDAIEGFHFDEPLLKLSGAQFREMTKFLAETFPDKRIFPVCCSYEINGTTGDRLVDPLSYEVAAYCTDIGYDNYHSVDIDYQREMINKMKNQVGRKNVRLWLFPCSYLRNAATDEDYLIEHLDMYYELLMEQENPGGLFLYSWGTHGTMTGFSRLTDSNLQWKYDRLLNRVLEISEEIRNTEYTYKIINN